MNSITPHSAIDDAYLSRSDEANLIEGRLQLEDEAYARKRRIRNRRQRQAKLQALGRIQRRNRAIKLAVFWAGAVALGTFVVIWNAGVIMQVFAHALRAV